MLAILIANSCESQRIIVITNGITYANTIAAGGVQAAALAHLFYIASVAMEMMDVLRTSMCVFLFF